MIILLGLFICNSALAQNCKRAPAFLKELGFDPNRSALTTTIQRQKGVVLVEYDRQGNINRQYQHPTWKTMGHAGKVTLGPMGDAYVLPTPMVNAYDNPAQEMNTIYKIDNESGKLEKWVRLPVQADPHAGNPYGLMGATIDCRTLQLYVSTISGSTYEKEEGQIFRIDLRTKKVESILSSTDAMGLCLVESRGQRFLYYGKARASEIWALDVNDPSSKPVRVVNLDGIGPRGDDRARKLDISSQGRLTVTGVPFYYNLTAPVMKRESRYVFQLSNGQDWVLQGIQ